MDGASHTSEPTRRSRRSSWRLPLEPALVVLSAATEDGVRRIAPEVRELATRYPVAIGGPGARVVETAELGVLGLVGDLVAEAARIASREHATAAS